MKRPLKWPAAGGQGAHDSSSMTDLDYASNRKETNADIDMEKLSLQEDKSGQTIPHVRTIERFLLNGRGAL